MKALPRFEMAHGVRKRCLSGVLIVLSLRQRRAGPLQRLRGGASTGGTTSAPGATGDTSVEGKSPAMRACRPPTPPACHARWRPPRLSARRRSHFRRLRRRADLQPQAQLHIVGPKKEAVDTLHRGDGYIFPTPSAFRFARSAAACARGRWHSRGNLSMTRLPP